MDIWELWPSNPTTTNGPLAAAPKATIGSGNNYSDLAVSGKYLYLSPDPGFGGAGISIYDVSTPGTPVARVTGGTEAVYGLAARPSHIGSTQYQNIVYASVGSSQFRSYAHDATANTLTALGSAPITLTLPGDQVSLAGDNAVVSSQE